MPVPPRRPSRSVRVPGRSSGPVRLGHQPTGSLFAPLRERLHPDDEMPQAPHEPGLPPHEPAGASPAGAGPDDTSPAPAEAGPGRDEPTAGLPHRTPGSSNAAPGSSPRSSGSSPGSAGLPSRVPARQGPPPKPAPGSTEPGAVPAPRQGGVPATRPGSVPATRPGAVPAPRQAAGPPARRPASQPSWGVVLVTTFRLWVHRRMEKTGLRVLAMILAAVILFAAGAITIGLIKGTPASNSSGTARAAGPPRAGSRAAGEARWPP